MRGSEPESRYPQGAPRGSFDEVVAQHFEPRLPFEQEKVAYQQVQAGMRAVLSELKRHYQDPL